MISFKSIIGVVFVASALVGCGSSEPLSKDEQFIATLEQVNPAIVDGITESQKDALLNMGDLACAGDPLNNPEKMQSFIDNLGEQLTADLLEAIEISGYCD